MKGWKQTLSHEESSVQCSGITPFLLGNTVLASSQPIGVQLPKELCLPSLQNGDMLPGKYKIH